MAGRFFRITFQMFWLKLSFFIFCETSNTSFYVRHTWVEDRTFHTRVTKKKFSRVILRSSYKNFRNIFGNRRFFKNDFSIFKFNFLFFMISQKLPGIIFFFSISRFFQVSSHCIYTSASYVALEKMLSVKNNNIEKTIKNEKKRKYEKITLGASQTFSSNFEPCRNLNDFLKNF